MFLSGSTKLKYDLCTMNQLSRYSPEYFMYIFSWMYSWRMTCLILYMESLNSIFSYETYQLYSLCCTVLLCCLPVLYRAWSSLYLLITSCICPPNPCRENHQLFCLLANQPGCTFLQFFQGCLSKLAQERIIIFPVIISVMICKPFEVKISPGKGQIKYNCEQKTPMFSYLMFPHQKASHFHDFNVHTCL